MGKKLPWLRLYTELPKDRKIRRRSVAERWLWVAVLCAAGESPVRGTLLLAEGAPLTEDDLADLANLPLSTVRKGLRSFIADDLLTHDLDNGALVVTKWDERQFKSDANGAERMRRSRHRKDPDGRVT